MTTTWKGETSCAWSCDGIHQHFADLLKLETFGDQRLSGFETPSSDEHKLSDFPGFPDAA
jgi:hypothetical protein